MSVLRSRKINITPELSLERITLSKLCILKWERVLSILTFPLKCLQASEEIVPLWQKIEGYVLREVIKLNLPRLLKEKVICLIKPIGLEILKWIRYHVDNCYLDGILPPNALCWTPQGTIDKMETAKKLIEDNNIDITNRYRLACLYCLEEKIPQLWRRIPDNHRSISNFINDSPITMFWTYPEMEIIPPRSFPTMCRISLLSGNKAALEFFLSKLTPTEREAFFSTFGHTLNLDLDPSFVFRFDSSNNRKYVFEVLSFSLSQMTEEQKTNLFRKYALIMLSYFLDWPMQSLFMETVNHVRDFLSKMEYTLLLKRILQKVKDGYKDYSYEELFVEFWEQSPDVVKSLFLQIESAKEILQKNVFEIKDKLN